jgi:hypothetical protein
MPGQFLVYTLADPRSEEIRYVGKTESRPQIRLNHHLHRARVGHKAYVYDWTRQVLSSGQTPIMEILEELPDRKALIEAECHWIVQLRALGCRLTNLTEGGEGCFGYKHSLEARKKMRGKRKPQPEEARQRRRRFSPEVEAKIAAEYLTGLSCTAIGVRHGMGHGGIRKILLRQGIKLRLAVVGRWLTVKGRAA